MKLHPEVGRHTRWLTQVAMVMVCVCVQVSQKELKEALRRQWSQLSDKRRLKWISKALELQKDYEVVPARTYSPRPTLFSS